MKDYGQFKTLGLCPKTKNCISTAEEANDDDHFVPTWTYNPEDGRGMRKPATKEQAMAELVEVVKGTTPDGFTPAIVKQTDEYLYVEYTSPTFGFIDDTGAAANQTGLSIQACTRTQHTLLELR